MAEERYGIDLLVVGAGVVGAAVAHYAARAGLRVTVVEQAGVASGSTGAGEGNLLVSDKTPGPELDLALLSMRLWTELAQTVPGFEYEAKGGLVVTGDDTGLAALRRLAGAQRAAGVTVTEVADPTDCEPHIRTGLAGGVLYPQDAQLMPALAAARLLDHPFIRLHTGVTVTGPITSRRGRVVGVTTTEGHYSCGNVAICAGAASGRLAAAFGTRLPITPRRGVVLVTAPVPPMIRHKVYTADYVGDVAGDTAALASSPVVEGTPSGPVLIGATRESVGWDRAIPVTALRTLASGAVALFPALAAVPVIRAYAGFRPFSPDHLPVIGPDPELVGLWHATGHEGAGVGLAAATGSLLAQAVTGRTPSLDLTPFRPHRFQEAT
ncbi:glycine/D-amino acid oxidase-like deaminating enzyme [Stackebrandtia albiflava]|uniref:Glycine/D-amino acid oxidase-like deaminating enzyme n=1 Tax=Stackebrandtia albiflava TaxID=406432 RepID=A0A562VD77_9ACTN|nr:FAD-dependent oxidoreductase [Stackebrandtia albiflava]TWJ15843.1 glycine/D-amino acid oxidase-like deaminating enzyme [Stackebrandtia albiflava]